MIGSSSFVTLVFTVVNLGADPAYIPILKIPLGSRKILKTPGNCKRIVSIRPSNQSWQILRITQAYIQRTWLRLETAFRDQGSELYLRSMQELILGAGQTRFLLGLINIQLLGSAQSVVLKYSCNYVEKISKLLWKKECLFCSIPGSGWHSACQVKEVTYACSGH